MFLVKAFPLKQNLKQHKLLTSVCVCVCVCVCLCVFARARAYIHILWRFDPKWATTYSFLGFLDHTQRRTTVGRTPLDEWSARRRDLYLTKHNTHNRQISMPPVGFEPTISAGERPQTYALDRAVTGNILCVYIYIYIKQIIDKSLLKNCAPTTII